MKRVMHLLWGGLALVANWAGAEEAVRVPEVRPELWAKFTSVRNNADTRARYVESIGLRATFCFSCHGKDGNSMRSHIPKLAGQNAAYLLEQVEKFSDGRRNHYVMVPLAKEFSDEDKISFALFFSRSKLMPAEADAALAQQGRPLYEAKCVPCHGADGRGSRGYARLAGQQPLYVENTLKGFRDNNGKRHSDLMEQVANDLTDQQIKSLANYVATIP